MTTDGTTRASPVGDDQPGIRTDTTRPVDLSICVPYYGEIEYLRHCLASLPQRPSGFSAEIIVVDDASPEPCAALIRDEFPHVRLIENSENLGFAGAVNRAARASSGRYLLVLNADTKVLDGVPEAVTYLDDNPDVGAVGPRLLNPDGSFQPQCRRGRLTLASAFGYACGLDRRFPRTRLGEYLEPWRPEGDEQDVAALSGACMMVRRDAFEIMGGLCEDFIMYGEDLDFCYRLGDAGWRVVYLPRANVIHAGGRGGSLRRYYRSRLLFCRGVWLVMQRHRSTRAFAAYGWLLGIALSLGFLGSCVLRPIRFRQVGSRKPAADLAPERWPSVAPALSSRSGRVES
ncbi:MAG: glycosyltransferase family 2 protein [Acidobacteriota bacterium]|jgi:GT2 family glycosyltransferase